MTSTDVTTVESLKAAQKACIAQICKAKDARNMAPWHEKDQHTAAIAELWTEYNRLNTQIINTAPADPAPAAVDTGRAHGPAFYELLDSAAKDIDAADRAVRDNFSAETVAARQSVRDRFFALYDGSASPAASIAAAAQSLGRELTTRDACALFAQPVDTVHCPDCRAVTEPDDNFCPACGNGLDAIRESLA